MIDDEQATEASCRNAAALWTARLGGETGAAGRDGLFFAFDTHPQGEPPTPDRCLLLRRPADPAAAARAIGRAFDRPRASSVAVVEDAFGGTDLTPAGFEVWQNYAVMVCETADVDPPPSHIEVSEVRSGQALEDAERVIVDGFPAPALQPWKRGVLFNRRFLGAEEIRIWLVTVDGLPASAGYAVDDGSAVGVYQVATLPTARRSGAGRALMGAIRNAYPDRLLTLTATHLGEPLYVAVGYRAVSRAVWWRRQRPA
jgi:ribosomal protein S18 acetylase RimI-like enzyme